MLKFQPSKGSVVFCDFKGFEEPEMVKNRPVLIIKKHKYNSKLVYILPISTTIPTDLLSHHFLLNQEFCNKNLKSHAHYIKVDMIYTVSIDRLNYVKKRDGSRVILKIDKSEFEKILSLFKQYFNIT